MRCLFTKELANLRDEFKHAAHCPLSLAPLFQLLYVLFDNDELVEFLEKAKRLVTALVLLLASLAYGYQSANSRDMQNNHYTSITSPRTELAAPIAG